MKCIRAYGPRISMCFIFASSRRSAEAYRALDAGALARCAQATLQLVAVLRDAAKVDGLHHLGVDNDGLRGPDGAVQVRPVLAVGGRFDGTNVARAQAAVDVTTTGQTRAGVAEPGVDDAAGKE